MGCILKNKQKRKRVFIHRTTQIIVMKINMKKRKRLRRYGKNRPKSRDGRKYSK